MSDVHARWDIRQTSRELLIVFFGLLVVNVAFFGIFVRPRLDAYAALTTARLSATTGAAAVGK